MTRVNWIVWAELGAAAALALGVIVVAAELHGRRRVLREASAVGMAPAFTAFVAADLKGAVAALEPSRDGLAPIRARTQRRAA